MNTLYEIAKKYHTDCDYHDEQVCSIMNKYGEFIHANVDEFNKVDMYAKVQLNKAYASGLYLGYKKEDVRHYINESTKNKF